VPGAGRFLLVLALAILADVAMIMMAFVVDFL
jgi:hypothetical protein